MVHCRTNSAGVNSPWGGVGSVRVAVGSVSPRQSRGPPKRVKRNKLSSSSRRSQRGRSDPVSAPNQQHEAIKVGGAALFTASLIEAIRTASRIPQRRRQSADHGVQRRALTNVITARPTAFTVLQRGLVVASGPIGQPDTLEQCGLLAMLAS